MHAFQNQPRDALWADQQEAHIQEVLGDEALPPTLVQSADCRQSVCRIALSWPDQPNNNYARLTALIGEHWGGDIGIEHPPDSRETRSMNVYVLRKDYALSDL